MQHILVCAHDSVLAKKVRFLLARDECEVEIISKVSQLNRRLEEREISLLILSRNLDGEDAIERLARLDPSLAVPPTLVLGGPSTVTADFIHVIPDPIDTQAIYRVASDLLANGGPARGLDFDGDEDLTHIAIDGPPSKSTTHEADTAQMKAVKPQTDELNFTDVTGLDEIAGRLDQLESDQLNDQLSDAFDIDEASDLHMSPRRPKASGEPPVLGGLLEPARFAKVLFQCWSKGATGALIVARDHETLTIHFERGSPIQVESSIPGDKLGRALVERGRVTEAQYADGAKRAIERGIRLGQALVELGFFSNEELGQELGKTARDQIVGCFEARQGAFEFDSKRKVGTSERPYRLEVGHVMAEGIRRHADDGVLSEILGDIDARYFKLRKTIAALAEIFPIDAKEKSFLAFEGRAYNVLDASDISGIDRKPAYKLLSLLTVCEEVDDFTPGVVEFEARIREERQRAKEMEVRSSQPPAPAPPARLPPLSTTPSPPATFPAPASTPAAAPISRPEMSPFHPVPSSPPPFEVAPTKAPPPPPPPITREFAAPPAPPPPASATPANGESEIPPMPVPANAEEGMIPRPLVYAKPLPRGPDGGVLETPERTLSREHFQRGVTLLGQGSFASAEEAFRDAVALCSEEHVYLIGLARAIYYNPGYQAAGKVPVLKTIVGRAELLAPEDKRVGTLRSWVDHAEQQL